MNPLEMAILGVQEELDVMDDPENDGSGYEEGYRQALIDTLENLDLLKRTMGA